MTAPKDSYYSAPFDLTGKRIRGRFVIPSGIRCVRGSVIEKCFGDLSPVGVITTKSISVAPRQGNREPIYAKYSNGSYINAVGLANPGAQAFRAELEQISVPKDKYLLVSIFGGDEGQFAEAARILQPVADGFELNMSCPHAAGYGIEIGQSVDLVKAITRAVVATGVPVFVKLSAILPQLGATAKAAIDAGAVGITVANTVGPARVCIGESPILSNRVGGLSGSSIRPLGLQAVRVVREAIGPKPVLIGMGGVGTAEHVVQFRKEGADLFGIGSALTGFDSEAVREYFLNLEGDLNAGGLLPLGANTPDCPVDMSYHRCVVTSRTHYSETLFQLTLDQLPGGPNPGDLSGRYYFLCIPGVGEKPFAVFSAADRSVVVKVVGQMTAHLATLAPGTEVWVRGPYGRPVSGVADCNRFILVGGGTGIASLLEIGAHLRRNNQSSVRFALGARTKDELFRLDDFERFGSVSVSTDDGSAGHSGRVSELLRQLLAQTDPFERSSLAVINCGPEPMIRACGVVAGEYLPADRIIGAVEYPTSCGVSVCGKCAAPSGHLSCIDGPFLPISAFKPRQSVPMKSLSE